MWLIVSVCVCVCNGVCMCGCYAFNYSSIALCSHNNGQHSIWSVEFSCKLTHISGAFRGTILHASQLARKLFLRSTYYQHYPTIGPYYWNAQLKWLRMHVIRTNVTAFEAHNKMTDCAVLNIYILSGAVAINATSSDHHHHFFFHTLKYWQYTEITAMTITKNLRVVESSRYVSGHWVQCAEYIYISVLCFDWFDHCHLLSTQFNCVNCIKCGATQCLLYDWYTR